MEWKFYTMDEGFKSKPFNLGWHFATIIPPKTLKDIVQDHIARNKEIPIAYSGLDFFEAYEIDLRTGRATKIKTQITECEVIS